MKNLKAAVIGLGVGEQHIRSYQSIEGIEITAICDVDSERLKEVGDQYNIGCRETDYRRLTEDPDIDVISICSFDNFHAEQAISAFLHEKHVMIEKPVALFRPDVEAILRAQQDSKRLISSNLILRQSPRFIEVKRRIGAGELGDIFYMEGDYIHQIIHKLTVGWRGKMDFYSVVYGGGIHLIDLMRWLAGDEVESVTGMGNDRLVRGSSYQYYDSAVSLLRFQNGAIAKNFTTLGPQHPFFHSLKVFGTEATFVNQLGDGDWYCDDVPENREAMTQPYPGMEKGDLLPDFINAIRSGRQPNVSATDVFRVMDICLAVHESIETGQPVKINYLY